MHTQVHCALILFLLLVILYVIVSSYVSSNREEVEVVERLKDYLKIVFVHDARAFDDDGTMCIDVKVRLKN